ncbi:hypothetical protein CRG98_046851 [Punica granatum]|uniref:Uncharacterized protein n=1 Tax=Punica granatum TaxID=22663 RepID=A0A2I0HM20_PUNGR|nr:hypothetical protein CRG98_046851 [Punica granatum]
MASLLQRSFPRTPSPLSTEKMSDLNPLFFTTLLQVNKPYLPLASGEYSVGTGAMIVTSSLIMFPLLRWKRSPVAAAMCILIVRALSNPTAYFLNMQDIPDIDGDKLFGIQSFTVFWICISLLEMAYVVAILVGSISPGLWNKVITVLGHAVLATTLWARAKSLDLKSKAAITSFYMFIWKEGVATNLHAGPGLTGKQQWDWRVHPEGLLHCCQ